MDKANNINTSKEIIRRYQKAMADQFELNTPLPAIESERMIMNCVRDGNVEGIQKIIDQITSDNMLTGNMSDDPLKQAQFTVVSGITLMTRYAISGGLSESVAYHLSDAYLQVLTNSISNTEAIDIFAVALLDFTERVNQAKLVNGYSLTISKSIRYINSHLHERITQAHLAKHCNVSPQYLSVQFHKEVGMTIIAYIRLEKLKIAATMLATSDYSCQRIATMLGFSSQSAFTEHFRKEFNITPIAYRRKETQI